MRFFTSFYHRRLALVDLDTEESPAFPIREDVLEEGIGGLALCKTLAELYPNALILAAGPYTGSFAPASGQLVALLPEAENCRQVALVLGHGAWLRRSGFDALVIRGKSASPRILRHAKGQCWLEDAGQVGNGARDALRAALLRRTEDGLAGLILADKAGKGAEENDLPSAAGAEYGPLPGGHILGPALQSRNILALMLEGGTSLPPVPIPVDNALRDVPAVGNASAFFEELALAVGDKLPLPSSAPIRQAACHHCPSPCLAWLPTPSGRHLLAADHAALAFAVRNFGPDYAAYLETCDVRGLDPVGSQAVLGQGETAVTGDGLRAPARASDDMRAGLVLGICPRLIRRSPGLTLESAAFFLGEGMTERVERAVNAVAPEVYL
jgi:aldehyde:ferredoxin oxidoreductase